MRNLSREEIAILESRGCQAEDWDKVTVSDDFVPVPSIFRVSFTGSVRLGTFRGSIRGSEGFAMRSGIDHARLDDVSVGDDCLIHRANVSSTDIGDNVVIYNVGSIFRRGADPFANGVHAHVLAEDGARSVPLWRHLTSQFAHLLCHLKKHPAGDALEAMIQDDALALRQPRCCIASGARVRHVKRLQNVWLAEGAWVDGAASLENCYVDSLREAPTRIGENVTASSCVFLPGCQVTNGVQLKHCLVGEGVLLDAAFSGIHSLFFANSEFAMGEAVAALAGPYSVSHHKSTLILTCQSSFSNFGSGSNSSNHHYKLGPIHGGVLRRGVRCGSGSYLFWPSDIGAFSTVIGKHGRHLDTADFPFSLVVGEERASILVPGVNLFTSGLFRDAKKWRDRDRRKAIDHPRDLVNPAVLSPYVLQAMDAGVQLLERAAATGEDLEHGGAIIPASRLRPALELYRSALVFHMGERLLSRAQADCAGGFPDVQGFARVIAEFASEAEDLSAGRWRDWGGMLLSGVRAERYLERLAKGELKDPVEARLVLELIHEDYEANELSWLARRWLRLYGQATPESIRAFAARWRETVVFRHACFVKDAAKEFSHDARIGFGIELDATESFRRVRGDLDANPIAAEAEAERERLLAMAEGVA